MEWYLVKHRDNFTLTSYRLKHLKENRRHVQRLRVSGAVPPFPNTVSSLGAKSRTETTSPLAFTFNTEVTKVNGRQGSLANTLSLVRRDKSILPAVWLFPVVNKMSPWELTLLLSAKQSRATCRHVTSFSGYWSSRHFRAPTPSKVSLSVRPGSGGESNFIAYKAYVKSRSVT
jgi:hypothetical protein